MLQTNRSKTINGQVMIDNQHIIHLNGTIESDGGQTHVSYSVTDQVLYRQNKAKCRASITDFLEQVFAAEDEMNG